MDRIRCVAGIVLKRINQGVKTIVMTRSTVGDIPWCAGVVEFLAVDVKVCDRRVALVKVGVTGEDKVNSVLEEERFENFPALFADSATPVRGADVPGTVASWSGNIVSTPSSSKWEKIIENIPTTIQGVFFRSTEAKSFLSQFSWALRTANGPLFSPSAPPGSSGAMNPWPRSVSVSRVT